MNLSDLIKPESICLDLKSIEKTDVIREMVDILVETKQIVGRDILLKSVLERERLGSTGVGHGVAIPHAKTKMVKEITITFGRSQKGINFKSPDSKPVHLVFLIASSTMNNGLYLKTLARLSRFLAKEEFREGLLQAKASDEVVSTISSFEERFSPAFRNTLE